MAYNRYRGGSGTPERVEEPPPQQAPPPAEAPPEPTPVREESSPPLAPGSAPSGPTGALDAALRRLAPEDLLVMAVLYLAYRSSGDWEMLAALGAYFLL